jgi:hypothetical protein
LAVEAILRAFEAGRGRVGRLPCVGAGVAVVVVVEEESRTCGVFFFKIVIGA